jgi:hypothetical protein
VKLLRLLSRIVLLSLVAAAFVGLTEISCRSVRSPFPPDPWREHRPSAPEVSQFPEFIFYFFFLVFWAAIGRIGLRLRLSPPSRGETELISLDLNRQDKLA